MKRSGKTELKSNLRPPRKCDKARKRITRTTKPTKKKWIKANPSTSKRSDITR